MKYVKMLGLAAIAAAALMAFVGASSASATTLTSPAGTVYAGKIKAVSETEKPTLTGGFKNVECENSEVAGEVKNKGSETETVSGPVNTLTFTGNCTCKVVVLENGTLEIHTIAGTHNGTLTSTGAKVTVNCENTIFGTVHCIYVTNATDLGTLTGSSTTGGTATMDITAEIPRESTNVLCAEEAVWHAKYLVTEPDFLDVD